LQIHRFVKDCWQPLRLASRNADERQQHRANTTAEISIRQPKFNADRPKEHTMPDRTPIDDVQDRVAAAIQDADSGSNHQVGVDGDDDSVADRANDADAPEKRSS